MKTRPASISRNGRTDSLPVVVGAGRASVPEPLLSSGDDARKVAASSSSSTVDAGAATNHVHQWRYRADLEALQCKRCRQLG
jgi:hypothetical protein